MPPYEPQEAPENLKTLPFPKAGIDISMAFDKQMPRPADQLSATLKQIGAQGGTYFRTCPQAVNVRAFDPIENRSRGASRCGISKFVVTQPSGENIIQAIQSVITMPDASNLNAAGRLVTLVTVCQGSVYYANAGDTDWTLGDNQTLPLATPPLVFAGIVNTTTLNQQVWFADGTNWVFYTPRTNVVATWEATSGVLPVDSDGNKPRLICTWRGRIVLSGLPLDPQNWFMSRQLVPTDFNYVPQYTDTVMAVAGNASPIGLVGDVVTTLIPFDDDTLVFGGDHTIWIMRGDPANGGQIDRVSDTIGMAWNASWCKDPLGNLYFVSNRMGVYVMRPDQKGAQPQRISQPVEQLLQDINTGLQTINLIWNDRFQGLHIFLSWTAQPAASTHFFYEVRTGAWWTDEFANVKHNPLVTCTFDGNLATDRVPLIGSWDGYVRKIDPDATDDDGWPIASEVILGPILTQNLDDVKIKDVQAVLGITSGLVSFDILVGATAEEALASTPQVSGSWKPGRNFTSYVNRAGHALYVRVRSTEAWAMEAIRCRLAPQGMVRMRGH